MVAKTVIQVNYFIITALFLVSITATNSPAFERKCPKTWQPTHARTCYDDLFYTNLANALAQNIRALQKKSSGTMEICGQHIPIPTFIDGYIALQEYLPHHSSPEISAYIEKNFTFCTPTKVLITGYYEPVVQASLSQTAQFPEPLYATPQKEVERTATRKTIATTDLLKAYEIVYVADPFTAFSVQIQGSALLTFADGSKRQVHYHNNNGRPYTSIGRILIDQGVIKREDMSMQAIKKYTLSHPEKATSLFHANARFIYFTLSEPVNNPVQPSGSFNIPLTPQRSIALDPTLYPQGLLFHLQGTLPVPRQESHQDKQQFHRREFSRFMLNQDSGSAIKGYTRVDMFMGRGNQAEIMASEMQEKGCLRVLLPK